MRRRTIRNVLLVLVPAILVAGAVVGVHSDKKLARRFGLRPKLDWANATTLVFEVDVARSKKLIEEGNELLWPGEQPNAYSAPDLQVLAETIKKRIDPEDEKEVIVRPNGETRIEVVIPPAPPKEGGPEADAEFAAEVRELLDRMGTLEFRILANIDDDSDGIACAQWIDHPTPVGGNLDLPGHSFVLYSRNAVKAGGAPVEYFVLTRVSDRDALKMTGGVRLSARVTDDPDPERPGRVVSFEFNQAGAVQFRALTERNRRTGILRNLAIVIDGKIVSSPTLNAVTGEHGVITGNYTEPEVRRLARLLNSGTLDVALKLVRE